MKFLKLLKNNNIKKSIPKRNYQTFKKKKYNQNLKKQQKNINVYLSYKKHFHKNRHTGTHNNITIKIIYNFV